MRALRAAPSPSPSFLPSPSLPHAIPPRSPHALPAAKFPARTAESSANRTQPALCGDAAHAASVRVESLPSSTSTLSPVPATPAPAVESSANCPKVGSAVAQLPMHLPCAYRRVPAPRCRFCLRAEMRAGRVPA
ncbi:hypothetical protein B0H16DRAFT_1729573 [Mycena metata]|uniref:Uncharacterized protein n=1 Tax=Mycena metata TaxID=1033252 RepID=A0AAD7N0R9_9AGAR|nr:hypothetical protein B0H16DRAFT_1729573 [Mycena metata]